MNILGINCGYFGDHYKTGLFFFLLGGGVISMHLRFFFSFGHGTELGVVKISDPINTDMSLTYR